MYCIDVLRMSINLFLPSHLKLVGELILVHKKSRKPAGNRGSGSITILRNPEAGVQIQSVGVDG